MRLIWLDLETTGLDPNKCRILEVAAATAELNDPFNVRHVVSMTTQLLESEVSGLDPFILDMHGKNGLLRECVHSSHSLASLEDELLQHVPEVTDKDDRPILAGSSIHFDHGFIRVHMPRLAKRLSHRHYDVSALKLFCQSMGMERFKKAEAHRAKDDVIESIEHAKECTVWLRKNLGRRPNVHMH